MRKDQFIKFWIAHPPAAQGGVVYEAETTALLARAATSPSTALAVLINTTIKGLKDDGIFALGDCLYVRGVHESQLACQNWIKDAHNSTLVNSPTFTAKQGFTGTNTKYINNNYNQFTQAVNLTTTSATIAYMALTEGSTNGTYRLGAFKTTGNSGEYIVVHATTVNLRESNYILSATNTTTSAGVVYVSGQHQYVTRTGTTNQAYVNGYANGSSTSASLYGAGRPDLNMYELCANVNGAPTLYNLDEILSFTFYGGYLNPTQVLALYTRMAYFYANVVGTF